jgi:signal transduction histidine kinase
MRSLFVKILVWSLTALVLSLVGSYLISEFVASRAMRRGQFMGRMEDLQLAEAREAYESGGSEALGRYLRRLSQYLPGAHYLTDAHGRDLSNGEDRSALLRQAGDRRSRPPWGQPVLVTASPEGRYRFVVVRPPPLNPGIFLPFHLLILVIVALFCWVLSAYIATPLRNLARTVERFGRGEWAVRARSKRRDEIGDLARTFDRMADKISSLREAERRLLRDISHELRSPLARMGFAVELTERDEDRPLAIRQLRKELGRLSGLVDSLLQTTRLEDGALPLNLQNFSLDALLRDLAATCAIEAAARPCRIRLDAPAGMSVRGDRELLHRAFENVLRNAIRHAPPDSAVEVGVAAAPGKILVTVRDHGPGVPEDLLEEIFQPFFRVDAARSGTDGGTGLGLAIVRQAVELHRGRVTAQNAEPGLLVEMELPATGE